MRHLLFAVCISLIAVGFGGTLIWVYGAGQIEGRFFVSLLGVTVLVLGLFLALLFGAISRISFRGLDVRSSKVGEEAKVAVEEINKKQIVALISDLNDSLVQPPSTRIELKNKDTLLADKASLIRKYEKAREDYGEKAQFLLSVELNSKDKNKQFSAPEDFWDAVLVADTIFRGEIYDVCFVYSDSRRRDKKNQFFVLTNYFQLQPNSDADPGEEKESWRPEIKELISYTQGCSEQQLSQYMEQNRKSLFPRLNFSRIDRNRTTLEALIEMTTDDNFRMMVTERGRPFEIIDMADILRDIFEKEIKRRRFQKMERSQGKSKDPNPFTISYQKLVAQSSAAQHLQNSER
ncbi:MAG: hypothetical protein AAGC95_18450 [Pseudomonadota bacterium]